MIKYCDKVMVKEGFYAGLIGKAIRDRDDEIMIEYLGRRDFEYVFIKKSNLELVVDNQIKKAGSQ